MSLRFALLLSFATVLAAFGWTLDVSAQSSIKMIEKDIDAQYLVIKDLLRPRKKTWTSKMPYDLVICDLADTGDLKNHLPTNSLANLAWTINDWTAELSARRYPSSLWKNQIDKFERDELARIKKRPTAEYLSDYIDRSHALSASLAKVLQAYRNNQDKSLKPVDAVGGCGADGALLKFVSDPAGGRVFLISSFYYSLCLKQNVDPADLDKCDWWTPIQPNEPTEVSGTYRYLITWPGGRTSKGPYAAPTTPPKVEIVRLK
jgi:hypothetical protein